MARPRWIETLVQEVVERDDSTCINCGRPADDPHHVIPKGRAKKYSPKFWREENICCLCRDCHDDGQTVWMRKKLIRKMQELGHDMSWAQDEVVMKEINEKVREYQDSL